MKKYTSKPPRAEMLTMRREVRELVAKTSQLTEQFEQLGARIHELAPAQLARLEGRLDLMLKIFEHRGPESVGRKTDSA